MKGFKSLRDPTLELMPVTRLVGPNGSGKTAVIEALLPLRDILARSKRISLRRELELELNLVLVEKGVVEKERLSSLPRGAHQPHC